MMPFARDRVTVCLIVVSAASLLLTIGLMHPPAESNEVTYAERPISRFLFRSPDASEAVQVSGWDAARIFRQIDAEFTQLTEGPAVFTVPSEMTVGESERIVVRIAPAGDAKDILKDLPPGIAREWRQAHITPMMKATVTGADFDVKPESSEEQTVGGGTYTE